MSEASPDRISVRSIIKAWPAMDGKTGEEMFASDFGVSVWAVRKWAWKDRIPPEHHAGLVDLARARGVSTVTFEALALMHAKKPSGATPAEECAR